jgi:metal-sulfur cluster biosynthetic enzyme
MPAVPQWALDALREVYDPCCREKGLSVVDMGLVRAVHQAGDQVAERIEAQPGVAAAEVEIVWDEAWTTDRMSERASQLLRFLPPPAQAGDRDAYLAAHQPGKGDQHDR